MPRPLYPRGNCLRYPLNRRLGGPLSGLEIRPLGRPAPSPSLYRLRYLAGSYLALFEVHTAVIMKSTNFWGVMSYSKVEGRRNILSPFSGSKSKLCFPPASSLFLAWITIQAWRWRQYVPLKHQWVSTGLHIVTSQSIVPSAVRWQICYLMY
jgi:hypothetical protein